MCGNHGLGSHIFSTQTLADSLCDSQERTLFSCKSKCKLMTLCSSKIFSENTGYIRYLYGKHGKIEPEYPNDKSLAKKNFKWSKVYSPGVNVYLKFNIGEFKYYVYSSQGESYNSYSDQAVTEACTTGSLVVLRYLETKVF